MALWFTADLHLGHVNILRYADRPFADVEAMNAELMARWNDTVRPGDTVWVLGDVALGRISDTLPLVNRLRGRKLLLAGNHDRCWTGHGPAAASWTERYLAVGFERVHQGQVVLDLDGTRVLACHFPYRGDSGDRDRHVGHRPADDGSWLLHGHVHGRWRQAGRMVNVGVDAWDFRPVSAAELVMVIGAGPAERAPLPRH